MGIDPLLPLPLVAAGVVVATGLVAARIGRRAPATAIARSLGMIVLAAVIAVDPTTEGQTSEARRSAADVLFVVDSTSSMASLDYDDGSPRLDGVRADILELAAEFPGAHFSLVRFDSHARLEVPWTTDVGAIETAVTVLRQERAVYSRGSQLDLPLDVIDAQLPRLANADRHSVVFYFSDGEQRTRLAGDQPRLDPQTAQALGEDGIEQRITSFAELAAVDGGAVFGYGTVDGAPMLEFVGNDELFTPDGSGYVYDFDADAPAISRIDEGNLTDIAAELGVPYLHRTGPGGLGELASAIAGAAPTVSDGSRETQHRLYWIPSLGLLALVLLQVAATANEAVATRRLFGGRRGRRAAVAAVPAPEQPPAETAA